MRCLKRYTARSIYRTMNQYHMIQMTSATAEETSSAVKHRPADVVAQPLIVKHKLANRLRKLATLPPALTTSRGLTLVRLRGSTGSFDRIGGGTKLMRSHVRNSPSLARSVCGMPSSPTKVSGRAHGITARRPSLHHLHLATHPSADTLDRLTRSQVPRLSRLEQIKDMLRARCRPKGEEMVIRIGEGSTAADRHETWVSHFREDHGEHPLRSTR